VCEDGDIMQDHMSTHPEIGPDGFSIYWCSGCVHIVTSTEAYPNSPKFWNGGEERGSSSSFSLSLLTRARPGENHSFTSRRDEACLSLRGVASRGGCWHPPLHAPSPYTCFYRICDSYPSSPAHSLESEKGTRMQRGTHNLCPQPPSVCLRLFTPH